MLYQRYFKNGQRLLLRTLSPIPEGQTHLLSAYMEGGEKDTFILSLPYSEDAATQYTFAPGMTFEISSDTLGLGIRATASFSHKVDSQRIALHIRKDLQMFQRRAAPRLDCNLGIRFTRGQGALKALRATWEKNVQVLNSPGAPLNLQGFQPCQVNLSCGGIRFRLRPPVNLSELCLMLIQLDDGMLPICTLAEVLWTRPEQEDTVIVSGMRFINILEADQKRIEKLVRGNKS